MRLPYKGRPRGLTIHSRIREFAVLHHSPRQLDLKYNPQNTSHALSFSIHRSPLPSFITSFLLPLLSLPFASSFIPFLFPSLFPSFRHFSLPSFLHSFLRSEVSIGPLSLFRLSHRTAHAHPLTRHELLLRRLLQHA